MRKTYKLGERVLYTDKNGIEQLATITGITHNLTTSGSTTTYASNSVMFNQDAVVGRVTVSKPRTRTKKKTMIPTVTVPEYVNGVV